MHKSRRVPLVCIPAKVTLITLALTAMLGLPTTGPAVDVFTEPVGFYKIPISPGPNFLSAPLHKIHTFRGVVSAVTPNSVTVTGNPNWTANQFGPQDGFDQYILLVRRDASAGPGAGIEGDWWPIASNTGNTVTLDTGGDNLTTLLAAGDHVEIRKLVSMQDLFGPPASTILNKDSDGDPNPAQEDVIRYVVGASLTLTIFVHDSGGLVAPTGYYVGDNGPYDGSTLTIHPDQAILLLRKSGSPAAHALSMGQVQVTRLTHYLQEGANPVGTGFAANAPIGTSGLTPPGSGWISDVDGDPNASQEDIIRVVVGGSLTDTVFHHNSGGVVAPTGWYVNDTQNDSYPLAVARGYLIFRKAGAGELRWRQVVPF